MRAGVTLAMVLVLGAGTARAQVAPPPAHQADKYSPYERQALEDALKKFHTRLDPHPEGKILEGVDIVTLDVFEKRDPVPVFFDVFHTKTRRYVIARQVLLREGTPYRQALVDDTIRNLRTFPQLSMVIAVATVGTTEDRVRLLVITKDVWSLRPNWDLELAPGGITLASAQPAETNVAGTHTYANLNFIYQPESFTFGAGYTSYRLNGTHVLASTNANVIWGLETGAPEGSYGGIVVGQPLYSPLTKWSWDASVAWSQLVVRRYLNTNVADYTDPTTGDAIPFQYRAKGYGTQYTLTRSFGWETKSDLTLGADVALVAFDLDVPPGSEVLPAGALPGTRFNPATLTDFTRSFVPVGDDRVGPFVQYHLYEKRYVRMLDFDTLGLQEDFRLGPKLFVNFYPDFQAIGSSRDLMGVDVSAQYTAAVKDGLIRAGVESITEFQTDQADALGCAGEPAPCLSDGSIQPALHIVTPTLKIGRFVFDSTLLYRYRNYLNQQSYLGGDSRLRGYPTNFLVGADAASANLEFRTRSIDILTAQVGLVAFIDAGDAFDGFSQLRPYDSVGAGLRVLFPQLDRLVLRLDLGVPVGEEARFAGVAPVSYFFAIDQAFRVPQIGPGGGLSASSASAASTLPGALGNSSSNGSPSTALPPPP